MTNQIQIQKIQVGRRGPPKDLSWINFDEVEKMVTYAIHEREIVIIEPGGYGGNHSHPRTETWLALGGELILHYIDGDDATKTLSLNPQGEDALLVKIAPNTPHAVTNKSKSPGILIEWADDAMRDENVIEVLNRT